MDAVIRGWPGLFRPLWHHVPTGARTLRVDGGWIWFAVCGSPCLPPESAPAGELPWCRVCWRARTGWP